MKNVKLAGRYAKALYDFAVEKNQIEQVHQDVLHIMGVLKLNHNLCVVIESPIIQQSRKVKIFTDIFKAEVTDVVFGFLKLIIEKKREPELSLICEEFIKLYYKHHNIVTAQLITAQQASDNIIEKLRKIIEEKMKANVKIQTVIKPDIMGGFIVKIEDFIYDASVIRHINELKREFSQNMYQAGI
ncbi:ATP synthase F1 subunit delta [Bacteroidales bacterium OttesenSCG-928-B11]|nr:ATP synthase F1 subunit delta [Bacteroidales bacterium OttesenSCG-928-C03]MDL2311795.1 ATP synthase F1 subunit delta [Bacteroidales bacterium OttesenSCG-928-B11]MDL2326200.1 ATP synthase F1 subunit delta [Bacteroidales bacterium OttesenSCG-928-A14]